MWASEEGDRNSPGEFPNDIAPVTTTPSSIAKAEGANAVEDGSPVKRPLAHPIVVQTLVQVAFKSSRYMRLLVLESG